RDRGIEKRQVQEFPFLTMERSLATPSTCPRTKWPESRSPQARAFSRLTASPGRRLPSVERARVSPERSATSRLPLAVAVSQTPETQRLSPSTRRPYRGGVATVRSAPPPRRRSSDTTFPRPVTIPENMFRPGDGGGAPWPLAAG